MTYYEVMRASPNDPRSCAPSRSGTSRRSTGAMSMRSTLALAYGGSNRRWIPSALLSEGRSGTSRYARGGVRGRRPVSRPRPRGRGMGPRRRGGGRSGSRRSEKTGGIRSAFSFVLQLEQDDWKIVFAHVSIAEREDSEAWAIPFDQATSDLLDKILSEEPPDLSGTMAPDGTVTLVFTDIEGSTALNASFGDKAWLDVLHAHNQVVTSVTLEHGGTVVKGVGDGFMLAFTSARTCVGGVAGDPGADRRDVRRPWFADPGPDRDPHGRGYARGRRSLRARRQLRGAGDRCRDRRRGLGLLTHARPRDRHR